MPMHTGSMDDYRKQERRALAIGQQIAPGSVAANDSGLGFRIMRRGSGFTAVQGR